MAMCADRARERKEICLEQDELVGIGIDVHKRSYAVSLWSVQKDLELKRWTQPADPQALMRKLTGIRPHIRLIAYEAGPTGFVLARALEEGNWPVLVTSPAGMLSSRNASKSDRADARHLARLASKNMLSPCRIPTAEQEQERSVVRLRGRILADKCRSQLRIKSLLLLAGIEEPQGLTRWSRASLAKLSGLSCSQDLRFCLDIHIKQLEQARQLLASCDKCLAQIAERPHNSQDAAILTRIPGIATTSALQFMSEMGPRGRFRDRIEVAKYQGLAPEVRSSGESRREGDLNDCGNRRLRTMLVEAAWRWIRYDTNARAHYGHMLGNTGCSQKAIVAVARKLGIVMWHLRETQGEYETNKVRKRKEPVAPANL